MRRKKWERRDRIIVEVREDSEKFRVVIGETCGAPTGVIAAWITDIHNYQILPWYKRLFKIMPRFNRYQFEFVEDW